MQTLASCSPRSIHPEKNFRNAECFAHAGTPIPHDEFTWSLRLTVCLEYLVAACAQEARTSNWATCGPASGRYAIQQRMRSGCGLQPDAKSGLLTQSPVHHFAACCLLFACVLGWSGVERAGVGWGQEGWGREGGRRGGCEGVGVECKGCRCVCAVRRCIV